MNVKETFLKLTSHTYPHGTEKNLFDMLPDYLEMDEFGNLYKQIGKSDCMFTSHLDTAGGSNVPVNHVIEGKMIKTDGKSILGADDKAGVTVMLYMMEHRVPGLYYFFLGEEVGCVGSRQVAEKHKKEKLEHIKKVISFDRRDTHSVITFQSGSRCCSDTFGLALAQELNKADGTFKYEKDPTGVYTDSAKFVSIYPECTNISVGYWSEHTSFERQDIEHLTKLAKACLKVNWNGLPVERDPSKVEYDDWGYGGYYGGGRSRYSLYDDWYDEPKKKTPAYLTKKEDKIYFHDVIYNFISYYVHDLVKGYTKVDISPERVKHERELISDFLDEIGVHYKSMLWDGCTMTIYLDNNKKTETNRQDLIEYIGSLDLKKLAEKSKDDNPIIPVSHKKKDEYLGDI